MHFATSMVPGHALQNKLPAKAKGFRSAPCGTEEMETGRDCFGNLPGHSYRSQLGGDFRFHISCENDLMLLVLFENET